MRGRGYLVVLTGIAVLAAGCGSKVAPGTVAAAVTDTAGQTARVAVTTTIQMRGMSVSVKETGAFDFARSRGVLRMRAPGGMASEALFIPPRTYLKIGGGRAHLPLPRGKSWIAIPSGASHGLWTSALGPISGPDPRDLLASLTAISKSVIKLGAAAIRGVQVTGYRVSIDPAKAAARVPRWQRSGFLAFARSLGRASIPVDVWVDQQNLVRRVRLSLRPPGRPSGMPRGLAGGRITQTVDFYSFGMPVRVSAPPAAEVASMPQFFEGPGPNNGGGFYGPANSPRVSGTLRPAEAAAAEQAVREFWSGLAHHDARAAALTVLPAQRACFRGFPGPRISVSSLRITSAQPAGDSRATVWFTVRARATIGGHTVPVLPQGPRRTQWLMTTTAGGHWYVDLSRSSLGPTCR
jgi:hypothetical protein